MDPSVAKAVHDQIKPCPEPFQAEPAPARQAGAGRPRPCVPPSASSWPAARSRASYVRESSCILSRYALYWARSGGKTMVVVVCLPKKKGKIMLEGIQELWLGFLKELLHLVVLYIGSLLGISA